MRKFIIAILVLAVASVASANDLTHDGSGTGTFTLHSGMITGANGYLSPNAQYQTGLEDDPVRPSIGASGQASLADALTIDVTVTADAEATHLVFNCYGSASAPTGATESAVAMTSLWTDATNTSVFWKPIAGAGSYTMTATWGASQAIMCQGSSINNAHATPFGAVVDTTGVDGVFSLTPATEPNDTVLGFFRTNNAAPTLDAGSTEVSRINDGTTWLIGSSAPAAASPSTTTTVSWTQLSTDTGVFIAVPIKWNGDYQVGTWSNPPTAWDTSVNAVLQIPETQFGYGIRVDAFDLAGNTGSGDVVVGYSAGSSAFNCTGTELVCEDFEGGVSPEGWVFGTLTEVSTYEDGYAAHLTRSAATTQVTTLSFSDSLTSSDGIIVSAIYNTTDVSRDFGNFLSFNINNGPGLKLGRDLTTNEIIVTSLGEVGGTVASNSFVLQPNTKYYLTWDISYVVGGSAILYIGTDPNPENVALSVTNFDSVAGARWPASVSFEMGISTVYVDNVKVVKK